MSHVPPVTVILPVFNEARFLRAAVDSILAQTFEHFELIVVDDGSTDDSLTVLSRVRDRRLRILSNGVNLGITTALNHGLAVARGRYLARMDADDIALPDRLARQVAFLDAHPEIGIVGSARTLIDEDDRIVGESTPPPDDLSIRWKCLLGNPFGHPTVMLRRCLLTVHCLWYREVKRAEDYDLWPRLLAHTKGANLRQPLLRYRLRERNTMTRRQQHAEHDRIAHEAIRMLLPSHKIALEEVTQLRGRFGGFSVREESFSPGDGRWIRRYFQLLDAFCDAHANDASIHAFRERQHESIRGAAAA